MTAGAQIKAARALLGWSQEELAAKSAVSMKTIARAEAAEALQMGWATTALLRTLQSNGITFLETDAELGVTLDRLQEPSQVNDPGKAQ